MHFFAWPFNRSPLFRMRILTDRTALIQAVDKMDKKGDFALALGKAALLADQDNLKKLVSIFPELFIEGHGLRLVYERNDHLSEGQRYQCGESGDISRGNR